MNNEVYALEFTCVTPDLLPDAYRNLGVAEELLIYSAKICNTLPLEFHKESYRKNVAEACQAFDNFLDSTLETWDSRIEEDLITIDTVFGEINSRRATAYQCLLPKGYGVVTAEQRQTRLRNDVSRQFKQPGNDLNSLKALYTSHYRIGLGEDTDKLFAAINKSVKGRILRANAWRSRHPSTEKTALALTVMGLLALSAYQS